MHQSTDPMRADFDAAETASSSRSVSATDRSLRLGLPSSFRRLFSIGPVARNVAVVAGGTALGQLIVIGGSPVISRLYTPTDLGILAVYASCISLSQSAVSVRYDLALQLPSSRKEAARLLLTALLCAFVSSTLLGLTLWFERDPFAALVGIPRRASYVMLIPVGVLGAAMYQALAAWTIRNRRFRDVARTRVSQQAGLTLTQIGLGLLRTGPIGLLVGDALGRVAGTGSLAGALRKHDLPSFQGVSLQRVLVTARRYLGFAALSSASGVLNSIGLFAPPLLFSALFGPATAGQIALGQRVIALPLTLAGQSVAQVYVGELARLAREMPHAIPRLLQSTVRRLAIIALIPSVVLICAGPWLFTVVFGHQWQAAGLYARVLAFAFAAQMIAAPISQTLNVLGHSRRQLAWDLCRSSLVLGGIWGVWRAGLSPLAAVLAYSATMLLTYALLVLMASTTARHAASEAGRNRE